MRACVRSCVRRGALCAAGGAETALDPSNGGGKNSFAHQSRKAAYGMSSVAAITCERGRGGGVRGRHAADERGEAGRGRAEGRRQKASVCQSSVARLYVREERSAFALPRPMRLERGEEVQHEPRGQLRGELRAFSREKRGPGTGNGAAHMQGGAGRCPPRSASTDAGCVALMRGLRRGGAGRFLRLRAEGEKHGGRHGATHQAQPASVREEDARELHGRVREPLGRGTRVGSTLGHERLELCHDVSGRSSPQNDYSAG